MVCFRTLCVGGFEEMRQNLTAQGYLRLRVAGEPLRLEQACAEQVGEGDWCVIQNRVRLSAENRPRLIEALETAFHLGQDAAETVLRRADVAWEAPRCHRCDWSPLREPVPELFSGNSPLGACPCCKGYGRAITYDYAKGLLPERSIADGALKMLSSPTLSECYRDFVRVNKKCKAVRMHTPWCELTPRELPFIYRCVYFDCLAIYRTLY